MNCSYCKTWDALILIMCYVKSLEQIPLFVQTGVIYSQALIRRKLMKFTVLYTATVKGDKQPLRKSYGKVLFMTEHLKIILIQRTLTSERMYLWWLYVPCYLYLLMC